MAAQVSKQDAKDPVRSSPSSSEVFAIVQQISSQVDKDRIPKVIEAANGLNAEDNQLLVDLLGMVRSEHSSYSIILSGAT
jgi:hypothetical protein